MKKLLVFIILIICILIVVYMPYKKTTILKYDDFVFETEIRDTIKGRRIGLMNHESLERNQAMLFVFKEADKHGFWMKNMKFPIDILWLDEDYKIVDIKNDIPPCVTQECIMYYPSKEAKYVLEIYPNLTNELNMSTDQAIELNNS
jgi:uncharacterized protein